MAIANITMQETLDEVMSTGNQSQNQHYPPSVFTRHYNLVSSFLLDEIVKLFPTSSSMVDIIKPFLKKTIQQVNSGVAALPDDYRNILNVGMFTNENGTQACRCEDAPKDQRVFADDPLAPTQQQKNRDSLGRKFVSVDVKMVQIDEWNNRVTHSYKKPTYKKPICCMFEGIGLKVFPFDIPSVEIRYVRQPKKYAYNYRLLPDDTYVFDPANSTESEWQDNARTYLYKGVSTLYASMVRDTELAQNTDQLKKAGLF